MRLVKNNILIFRTSTMKLIMIITYFQLIQQMGYIAIMNFKIEQKNL